MTLTDAGPLIALVNRNDPNHMVCVAGLKQLPGAMLTTWACFTEALYLLHKAGGYPAQAALWQLRTTGLLTFHELTPDEIGRMAQLMEKYQDKPMDLADASLLAAAERLGQKRIFTLDGDFRIYRLKDGSTLEIVP